MLRSFFLRLTGLAFLILFTLPAMAQVPPAQNTSANPGRVQEQIQPAFNQTAPLSPVEVKPRAIERAPKGAEKITFVLQDLELTGVTAYTPEQLRPLYADQIGKTISLADLYDIAGRITQKFRNDGYVLTQVVVPPQSISKTGGTAKLRVVEGYIDNVTVKLEDGARPEKNSAMALVQNYARRMANGRALNIGDLERNLLLINDLPGVSARGVLAPSATHPGAADLTVLMKRDWYEALVGLDNYGTRFLGPVQLSGAAAFNSVFGHNERLSLQAVVAPPVGRGPDLAYLALGYSQPLTESGLRFDLNANHTETKPAYRLRPFNVHGHADFIAADLFYPVIRSRATNLYTTGTFDMRDVRTTNNLESPRIDHIRALRGDVRLEHLDTIFGAGMNIADFQLSQGIDIFGASDTDNPNKSRADGHPTFTKATLEAQRLQRLADHWNLLIGAHGQLSSAPLLTSEQFGVGGMSFGRGYDPSEILGDSGYAAKAELQWNVPGTYSITHDNQLFTFYDIGQVWTRATTANLRVQTADSAGLGIRSKIMKGTNVDFTIAKPLNRRVATENNKDPRVFFSVTQKF